MQIRLRYFLLLFGFLLLVWVSACTVVQLTPTPPTSRAALTPTPPAIRTTQVGATTTPIPRPPTTAPLPSAANLKGTFVFVRFDGGLGIQDATGANQRDLVPSNGETYAASPVFSPDGKVVAYSFNYFNAAGLSIQDLRAINADGSNGHTLIAPENPKISFGYPAWTPDGKEIFFTQSYSVPPDSVYSEIDRISANGGTLQLVLKDGFVADISPDGKKIVFRRLDAKTFASSLWIANIDGTGAKQVIDQNTFFDIATAVFTPDSQSIVFAGSGEARKKLPGMARATPKTPDDSCALALAFVCLVERASAHGAPSDLYMVDLAGTKFERLTNMGADSPYPAWSPDGRYVGFLSGFGIYVVDRPQNKVLLVSNEAGYGGFDWGK